MSDPNKFINTYIDTITATLHEYLGSSLQLKTQLKLANDLLQERDGTIASLNASIETLKQGSTDTGVVTGELASCRDKLKIAEDSHNVLKVKVSHMDTLTAQLTEMKADIRNKIDNINQLSSELETSKKEITNLQAQLSEKIQEISAKDLEIADLKSKPVPVIPTPKASSASSSMVKVQLNNKNKVKELPIDTDDF